MTLTQTNTQATDLQEKINQLQNALSQSESDRRVIQEKLDQAKQALGV